VEAAVKKFGSGTRRATAAGVGLALCATLGAISPALASDPGETTLANPGRKTSVTAQFAGTIAGTGAIETAVPCTAIWCDTHALHVTVPSNFWAQRNGAVILTIAWEDTTADLDVVVLDADANEVASIYTASAGPEVLNLGELPPGDYSIEVRSWVSLPQTDYTGTIVMTAKKVRR
jgi:hypothetical protein